ncbi:type IV toxin-antitoxin system AbiEi family antitoxin domain-containing protein [Arthrobacter sp. B10-11]|uniref:type IV toxin-antitoxin system AbiEi family antitoxin domain-containing protein n=1 Tax=Arthrobacter sp. B10-11 TaxID=3081160 RepID=UPI002954EB16|nr:type IV toxin-antitoxin system AbiEi family antitoxin domain-containing protein [Arthrobacter sp. B10-11]MDV8146929.1 type IV toxin-antitoxin system AbiEi family antitoxin domain-containing protein [Arthrobacter sp. B10-11]
MTALPKLVLAKDLSLLGRSPRPLSAAAKAGRLIRIRHGVYVDAEQWKSLETWQQYMLRIEAGAETCEAPTVFSHHSGASVWGIPTILRGQPVHALTTFRGGGRSRAGIRRHVADPATIDAQELDGLLVTSRVTTVLDLAAFVPFAESIVPLDHVLKADMHRGLPALTKSGLLDALPGRYSAAAERRVRAAIEFADPKSGSAGESYSRGLIQVAGFAAPALQYEIRNSTRLVGYSDFYWDDIRAVGEFDGVAKYQRDEFLRGRTPGQVVVEEKMREDCIRATGRNVVRWVWADLWKAGELERKLAAAGVPRRRTRYPRRDAETVRGHSDVSVAGPSARRE